MITKAVRAEIEVPLQPFDRGQVEMVGRLVEQEDIGRWMPARAPARRGVLLRRRVARALPGRSGRVGRGGSGRHGNRRRLEAGLDVSQRRCVAGKVRLLRQIAYQGLGLHENGARSGSTSPAAIFSSVDLPDPLRPTRATRSPRRDRQLCAREKRRAAEAQCDVFELKERRSHVACCVRLPKWPCRVKALDPVQLKTLLVKDA